MNIDHVRLFVRIAALHNISAAGKELNLSAAVASSYINKLEEHLGVRLIHRTTRKVSLTEEGSSFLPHAEDVLASVEAANAAVGAGITKPTGTLRVTAPASFGRLHLMQGLKGFLEQYPELTVDFRFSDSIVDMVQGGYDIAIRDAELQDSTLIARKLAPDRRVLCASPEYIKKYGEPKTPEDLTHHQCAVLTGLSTWSFKTDKGVTAIKAKGRFKSDNGDAVREASVAGLGITINSTWSAYQELKSGSLVEVLKNYPLESKTAIWAVYPSSRLVAPKVRAFIDYYSDFFGEVPYWDKFSSEE